MTAPMLNLPDEILDDIFCNVADCLLPFDHPPDYAQIKTLRSVCRTFRTITNDMLFWYKADFDIVELISPYRNPDDLCQNLGNYESFVKTILCSGFTSRPEFSTANQKAFQQSHDFSVCEGFGGIVFSKYHLRGDWEGLVSAET